MIKLVSADEVFAMAIQLESNGARFYRKAAELQKNDTDRENLMKLASMEDGHIEKFKAMRKAVAESTEESGELHPEGAMYLEAVASGFRMEGSPTVTASLSGNESTKEILQIATELEKEAILFYVGMKKIVSDPATQQVLDEIIDEERYHIVSLIHELNSDLHG